MKEFIIKLTWTPTVGELYQVVEKTGHLLNKEPKASYSYQRRIRGIEDSRLELSPGDVFMYLGEKQRIPEYYSFFKILHKDLVCWLIMSERLYAENHKVFDPIKIS